MVKDEIKEILEITETADYKRLSVDEIIVIKDYIINLQKENKQTKLLKELYKLRNEKAIEILKDTNVDMPETLLIETIDYARHILNGGDDNE